MLIGVYGAAGCGRGIMPIIREQYPQANTLFVDDGKTPAQINGHDVIGWLSFLEKHATEKAVSIAIADSVVRQKLAEKCQLSGISLIEARAESVVQMDDVIIGNGACLSPSVILTSNIRIGLCFHANLQSCVEHDCVIGDFVTLAPSVKVNGNVTIGDHAYIGAGAVIRQGITIGAGATIGMGAVVVRDVQPGTTVVGNPAKELMKRK